MQPSGGPDLQRVKGERSDVGGEEAAARSWAQAPRRLLVLLAILAGVAAYGLPRIIEDASGAAASTSCQIAAAPTPVQWNLAEVHSAVAASGLEELVGDGTVDVEGLQEPNAAWSDQTPVATRSADARLTPADGGYEIRWWSRDRDHQAADMFVFRNASDAARYVRQASSRRCRHNAASYGIAQPAGARALVWHNPEGYLQADLFFSRANRAYRITDVPPNALGRRAGDVDTRELIKTPRQLACQLKDAICTASLAAPSSAGNGASAFSFGQWAGYVWEGGVTSVQGSWTVPRILSGSPPGFASTWIGTQAGARWSRSLASAGLHPARQWSSATWSRVLYQVPFIQVGTNEEHWTRRGSTYDAYYTFWTDTAHHFSPVRLFVVRPGDKISAKLVLAHRRWTVSILDVTTGSYQELSTGAEAGLHFDEAGWFQEHPQYKPFDANEQYSYPELSTVRMSRLRVNARAPRYVDVLSEWMSADGQYLAPSPLTNDSFELRRATLTATGKRYLTIAGIENAAAETFNAQLSVSTASTPQWEIAADRSSYAHASRATITALTDTQWPATAKRLIDRLIAVQQKLLAWLGGLTEPSNHRFTSRSEWLKDAVSDASTAHAIRRALNIPQLTPTQ